MKRPTYTLSSIIKKVFRPGERSLPRHEVCIRLDESGLAAAHNLESEALLAKVLRMEQSPVRVGRSEAIVELTYQPHQLFDLAYRFLRDTSTPQTVEKIVAELRRRTQFSWNQLMRMLQLEHDPRFVQYEGDHRWFLAEWNVANDRVFAFCRDHGITRITTRSLSHFIEQEVGLSVQEYVFLPDLDDRFRLDGETLCVVAEPSEHAEKAETTEIETHAPAACCQEAAAAFAPAESDAHQKQHEQLRFEEEAFMNTVQTHPTLQEVEQLLRQALERLQSRNHEMSQEVINYFQESNMQAIELLMKEKHKNEQIADGIRQVLAACEQQ
jgi:hypothetical protein